jgi:protein O-mannosyl-transferase
VILTAATTLAFTGSLSGAFVLDDIPAIAENPHVRSLFPLSGALTSPGPTTVSGRPIVSFSLALNHALSTGDVPLTPYPFHVGNLVIHVLAGLTLFAVLRRTFRSAALFERFGTAATPLAFSIALLWMVHPLQTSSITYIIQRAEALMGLFVLLTLYCAIRAHGSSWPAWNVLAVVAGALGVGSKEVAVVAPILVLAWDWLFTSPRETLRDIWSRRWPLYAALSATWVLLAVIVAHEHRPASVGFGFENWPWWRYLVTQTGVILHYLRLTIVPSPLVLDYGWPAVSSLTAALPALAIVVALATITAIGFIKRRPASFAGIVFFVVLAPTSSVLPIITEVAAEHRMYLPLASVLTLVVIGAYQVGRIRGLPTSMGLAGAAVAALTLAWLTHARNADYATEERIWADTVAKRPDNPRGRINYGVVLLAQGRTSEAESHLRKAVELSPDDDDAQLALGAALCSTGRCGEGLDHLHRAAALAPQNPAAARNLAEALAATGDRRQAVQFFRRAVDLRPDDVFLLNQASWLLATAPEPDVRDGQTALSMAERAVRLTDGRDAVSLDSLAAAYAELNRFAEARAAIQQAIAAEQRSLSGLGAQLDEHRHSIDAGRPIR